MSINTWIPDNDPKHKIADAGNVDLQDYIALGSTDNIEQAISQLSELQVAVLTPLMKQAADYWQLASSKLSSGEIICLIRFFTVAEEKHSVLASGKQSPVIALNKELKKRNTPLGKEELLWIKQHSSNRFLPNGSIL